MQTFPKRTAGWKDNFQLQIAKRVATAGTQNLVGTKR
jgi:hypothetical protein